MNAIHALSQLSYVPSKWFKVPGSKSKVWARKRQGVILADASAGVKLSASEYGLSFLEKRGDTFFFVLGREANGEEVDLAAEAFVQI